MLHIDVITGAFDSTGPGGVRACILALLRPPMFSHVM